MLTAVALAGCAAPARAQTVVPGATITATVVADRAEAQTPSAPTAAASPTRHVSFVMQSLYVTTAVVQGLDARSTFKAIDAGAVEVNPIIEPLARRKPAFIAFKAGVAAAVIYGGHSLSKRHKPLAIVVLSAVNAAYLAVVIHNYHVIDRATTPPSVIPH